MLNYYAKLNPPSSGSHSTSSSEGKKREPTGKFSPPTPQADYLAEPKQPVPKIEKTKKIKKPIPVWDVNWKFIKVDPPMQIKHPKMKKKYVITFRFTDGQRIHQKTIKFGTQEQDDYIDHKDEKKREVTMTRIRNYDNPLKGNYWRYNLLNKYPNIYDAYTNFLKEHCIL